MRAVNLLPAPLVERRQDDGQGRARRTKAIAIAAGPVLACVAVALGFAFVQERSHVNDRRSTLDGLHAKVAQTQAATASSAAVAAKSQAHLAAITSAASGRMAWDGLLDQLARVMPPGASLESLQANDGADTSSASPSSTSTSTSSSASTPPASSSTGSTTSAAPTGFVVTGYAASQGTVARALDRLALIPALTDVSLQSTQRADTTGKKALQFTIGANLRSAGGTPR